MFICNIRKAIEILTKFYPEFKVEKEALDLGIRTTQSCRLEYVPSVQYSHLSKDSPPEFLILDVGHNPPALVKGFLINFMTHYNRIKH